MTHREGEVWTERGKQWTIHDGLRQTVTKFDEIRRSLIMPFTCPKCGKMMKGRLDEKMWSIHKKCFDCVIYEETLLHLEGKYKDYEHNLILKNAKHIYEDAVGIAKEILNNVTMKDIVTEDGVVEHWKGDFTKEELEEIVSGQVDNLKKQIEEYENQ